MNISILCPTRGRVNNLQRLLDSALEKSLNKDLIEFVFYVDFDDEETKQFLANKPRTTIVNGERIVLSQMWNECAKVAQADIMMHCGDDIIFRTDAWDQKVLDVFEKIEDKIAFVHGNDGYWQDRLGTHGFLHKNWVNVVGYFVPPYFSSDYNDTWLTEVAKEIGRKVYLPDLLTEHMHPSFGKATWDLTHRERLERHRRDNPGLLYQKYFFERKKDAQKLMKFIKNCGGR